MNVLLLIVDSLRADFLHRQLQDGPATPFFDQLRDTSLTFTRAYATECWTLPTHASIFTGLLPSEHGAHFQNLHCGVDRTLASILQSEGFHTELFTRNSVLDGSIPGLTHGFARNTMVLSSRARGLNPMALLMAISKPRFRRQIMASGFFSALQRKNREFVTRFAHAMLPADGEALAVVAERMHALTRTETPYFLVANLYDVHAPYSPADDSWFAPCDSRANIVDNVRAMLALPYLGSHAYLQPGFTLPPTRRQALRRRYARAVELMDRKLATFFANIEHLCRDGQTCVIVASDHGEAFGEHDLYLHDASVYDIHLHVPLFVRHPSLPIQTVDRVVSTMGLHEAILAIARDRPTTSELFADLAGGYNGLAVAEHFFYPRYDAMAAQHRQNQLAVVDGRWKLLLRSRGPALLFDRENDAQEAAGRESSWPEFEGLMARDQRRMDLFAHTRHRVRAWEGARAS